MQNHSINEKIFYTHNHLFVDCCQFIACACGKIYRFKWSFRGRYTLFADCRSPTWYTYTHANLYAFTHAPYTYIHTNLYTFTHAPYAYIHANLYTFTHASYAYTNTNLYAFTHTPYTYIHTNLHAIPHIDLYTNAAPST